MSIQLTPRTKTAPSSEQILHPSYRPDIDGLRAVAVLLVMGYHAFPTWISGGFIGVDIFFVISGFLISTIIMGSLERGHFSYREFYARRIRRIFPALVLVLVTAMVLGIWSMSPIEYKQLGKHITAGAGFMANIAQWRESGYFDRAADAKPLLHLWSLGIEEQFYLVWPLLLGLVWRFRRGFLHVTILIATLSFLINISTIAHRPVAAFYSPFSRCWELMIGGILAYLMLHRPKDIALCPDLKAAVGIIFIAAGAIVLNKGSAFPGWWAFLPTAGAFFLITAGPRAWINRHLLGCKVMVFIGLISYPLYLWHWLTLYAMRALSPEMPMPSRTLRIFTVIASFILSWLTYKFLERPIRLGKVRGAALSLSVTMAVIAAAGIGIYVTNGLAFFYPKSVRDVLFYKYDYEKTYREGTCFLREEQDSSEFANCTSFPAEKNAHSLVLWGDSHAAQLYPGMKESFEKNMILTQWTVAGCPPILGYTSITYPHCHNINDNVFRWISEKHPDRVMLAANWASHDVESLRDTVVALKKLGIPRIDIVGPVPQWKNGLRIQLYRYERVMHTTEFPRRMLLGLDEKIPPVDRKMAQFAREMGVGYISALEILCSEEGCLSMLGDTAETMTTWDTSHLTSSGSRYLVSHFSKK